MRRPQVTQEAAERPIRRHGGDLPAMQIRELYALLRQMKEDCTFHPLPFALVLDGAWGAETPGRLRSPLEENDFLPLGRLGLGEHRVLLEGPGPIPRPCIGLIGGDFDPLDGDALGPGEGGWILRFRTEAVGEIFLSVKVPRSTELTRIELAADDQAP